MKDAVSVANNACWAIGELAIKVSAYFYTISFHPVLNSFSIHKIPFFCFDAVKVHFKLFGMGFLLVYVTYKVALHRPHHITYFFDTSVLIGIYEVLYIFVTDFICFQIGKEIAPVVITVVSCLVPILKSPEVSDF